MIHWSRLVYRQSYIKQDLRYTSFDQCIDCPAKSRTYDTLVLTTVSIVLHKVGLTMHLSRLVYRLSYKKQGLRYTGLNHRMDSPIGEEDQRFVGLKTARIGSVGLSTRNVGLSVRPLGLSVCRTIARRNIKMTQVLQPKSSRVQMQENKNY